jgi:hypothetical protein
MGEAAIGVRDAANLAGMADNAAGLAAECGACHEAVLATVQLPAPEPGVDHPTRAAYALDRLWAGLIEPSDEAFAEAVSDLSRLAPDGAAPDALRPVQRALDAGASRPRTAGAVLHTCARCHAPDLLPASPPSRGQVGARPSLQ